MKLPTNPANTAEIAAKWTDDGRPICRNNVQNLCAHNRVAGAVFWGDRWVLPADAVDPRGVRGWPKGKKRKNENLH